MNREIASAPEKSEASYCARYTAAVSRPSMEPCAHFPDWSLERAHGAGWGKREMTARRFGERALNVYILERPDAPRTGRLYLFTPSNNRTMAEWLAIAARTFLL